MSQKKRLQYPGEICRPNERIVERIEVVPFRPAYVPPVEYRHLQELEKIIRPMVAVKPKKPYELTPTLVQEIKDWEYKNFTLDLNVARTDAPLGLRDMGLVANTMTVITLTAGAAFSYKMNKVSNDPTPAGAGFVEDQFEIEELYITNTPQGAGTQTIIRIAWNPLLIRVRP